MRPERRERKDRDATVSVRDLEGELQMSAGLYKIMAAESLLLHAPVGRGGVAI
jgi:hypothetical protein